jgi:hypothetical protein
MFDDIGQVEDDRNSMNVIEGLSIVVVSENQNLIDDDDVMSKEEIIHFNSLIFLHTRRTRFRLVISKFI